MRKLFLLLILLVPLASSQSSQYGEIRLTIENMPPRINAVSLSPDTAYYDDTVQCHVDFEDETPQRAHVVYSWYVDGETTDEVSSSLTGFEGGQEIRCEAVVVDSFNDMSRQVSASTFIEESSLQVRFMKPVLNSLGRETTARELHETTGMAGITGMVTGTGQADITVFYIIGILAALIMLINGALWIRKSPLGR